MTKLEWKDYEKLAKKYANRQEKCHCMEFEEAYLIASEAFVMATKSWKPEKGAFSTHFVWIMRWQFTKQRKKSTQSIRTLPGKCHSINSVSYLLIDCLSGFNKDLEQFTKIVLNPPFDSKGANTPVRYKSLVVKWIKENLGWSRNRIEKVLKTGKALI